MSKKKTERKNPVLTTVFFPPRLVGNLADQIAKAVADRIAGVLEARRKSRKAKSRSSSKKFENSIFLDTSAIIDGRILEVAKLGFLTGYLVIPEFVLTELKRIADSDESLRRTKGRRGLDVISELKKTKGVRVVIMDEQLLARSGGDIDDMLTRLTKQYKGRLATSDFNLNKRARILGVPVLNVNELANALRLLALPGEELIVTIVQEGKGRDQGVGYLSDGTMIVVEDGAGLIGKKVDVLVARTIQTAAGRMLFTKIKNESSS